MEQMISFCLSEFLLLFSNISVLLLKLAVLSGLMWHHFPSENKEYLFSLQIWNSYLTHISRAIQCVSIGQCLQFSQVRYIHWSCHMTMVFTVHLWGEGKCVGNTRVLATWNYQNYLDNVSDQVLTCLKG